MRLFSVVIVLSALVPFVPGVDLGSIVFVLSVLLLISYTILGVGRIPLPSHGRGRARFLAITIWLFFSVFSVVWLIANGGDVAHWARAIVPFVFFIIYLLIPSLNRQESELLSKTVVVAAIVWALKVLFQAGMAFQSNGPLVLLNRLTFSVLDSVLVYPLVAIPFLLFSEVVRPRYLRWFFLVFFVALYVWIGYRGGLLIVGLCLVLSVIAKKSFGTVVLSAMVIFFLMHVVKSDEFDVIEQLGSRYSTLFEDESDGVRAAEWEYALGEGADSPLVGKGLGWQVPIEVAFKGVDLAQIGEQANRSSVGYIHSMPAYFFMNLGVIGFALVHFIYLPWSRALFRIRKSSIDSSACVALVCLFLFFQTQAAFRSIQASVLIVALLKIVDSRLPGLNRPIK